MKIGRLACGCAGMCRQGRQFIHKSLPSTKKRPWPAPQAIQEKFNSRPVAPTIFQNEPFGENVEGLSYFVDKLSVDELAVQKTSAILYRG